MTTARRWTSVLTGDLVGTKRADRRLPQQGGHVWEVEREELRRFVIENLEQIDFRKVDKFALVDLLTNTAAAPAAAETPKALPGVDEARVEARTRAEEGPGDLTGGVARTEASAVTAGETVQVDASIITESPAAEPGMGGAGISGGGAVPPTPPSSSHRRWRMAEPRTWGAEASLARRAARRHERRHG